jgi:hypothetical protein
LVLLAGCGSDPEPEPPVGGGGTAETPEQPVEEAEEPTEDVDPDAIPSEYPDVELTFKDLPELEGEWREALRTYVDYDRGLVQRNSFAIDS